MTRRPPGAGTGNGPDDQHREWARNRYEGLNDDEYTAAIKRAEGEG